MLKLDYTNEVYNMKRNGFTLAEVLIALAIVGIVTAMTIPNLVASYKKDGPIWLIGLSFDSKTRRLVDCAAERFDGSN